MPVPPKTVIIIGILALTWFIVRGPSPAGADACFNGRCTRPAFISWIS